MCCKKIKLNKLLLSLMLTFVFSQLHFNSYAQDNLPLLELNTPVLGEIEPKNSTSYRIKLDTAQYLFVTVEFKDIDVDVKLFGTDGQNVYNSGNLTGGSSRKTIHFVSEDTGNHRLEIIGLGDKQKTGKYKITVKEIRSASEKDRFLATGEKLFAEGELLQSERKKEFWLESIKKYAAAVSSFESADNLPRKGAALTNLGLAHFSMGQTQESLEIFKQALEIFKQTNERDQEAKLLNNIGSIYNRMGDHQNALEFLGQSLKLVRELKINRGEASILNNIASIYKVLGDYEKALDNANRSLAIYQKIKKSDSIANSLNSIGAIYDDMGEPQKALSFYERSLKLFQDSRYIRRQAVTLNNIGTAYSKLGDKQRALDIYLQVLTLVRESGNKVGESRTLNNIGSIYNYLGQTEKSLEYLRQSLVLNRQAKDRLSESATLTSIGLAHDRLGDSQKALEFYQMALVIAQEIEARHRQAIIFDHMGRLYADLDNGEKSLKNFNNSYAIWEALGETYQQSQTLFKLAEIDQKAGNIDEAESKINKAVKYVESYRAKIGSQELRTSYLSTSQNIYKFYVNLLMQLHKESPEKGFAEKAFNVSEQARARTMVESLVESRINIREGVDIELIKREREIQRKLNKKESARIRFANRKDGEANLQAVSKEIATILNEYKDIKTQIRLNSPQYAELTQPKTLMLADIQKMLDDDTVLIEYALGEKQSYVWAVKSDSMTSYELPKSSEITENAKKVHKLLISRNESIKDETPEQREERISKADKELTTVIDDLSKQIIHPIAKQLDKKRIVVVSEGILQYIPFAVLSDPSSKQKYQPLVVKHEIVNLPSASILEGLRNKAKERKTLPNSVAVIADPVFAQSDNRVAQSIAHLENKPQPQNVKLSLTPDDQTLGTLKRSAEDFNINEFRRLRFSRREADDIASFVPAGQKLKAVDFAADKDSLMNADLSKYKIIHFATHGLLNNKNPELSGIVLSLVDERGKPKDGFLRLHEIYNMKIGANLVVLSACQTALGKDVRGEGLIGLTRGFMYAGAESVVASLWQVEDRATAELMKKFYRAMLKEGQKPAAALRTAQIEMSKDKRWNNPYYWAAFTLQGEWK